MHGLVSGAATAQSLIGQLDAGALDLVVGFRSAGGIGLVYDLRRVEMNNELRDAARGLLKQTLIRYGADEPMSQDPDRPLRAGEWFATSVQVTGMQQVAQALSQPLRLELLNVRELDRGAPAWYAFVANAGPADWSAFIRRSRTFTVARRGKLIAFFREDTLVKAPSESRTLRFDENFDLVLQSDRVLVSNVSTFDDLFTDREEMVANVPRQVEQLVTAGIVVANPDEFTKACQGNLYMMRKLSRIVDSGYVANITPQRVLKLAKEFDLEGKTVEGSRFVFDPKHRWLLLKILDDDYLRSPLTTNRYESSAKVKVQTRS